MSKSKTILLTVFFAFAILQGFGQPITVQLERYFNEVRSKRSSGNLDDLLKDENAGELLQNIRIYYKDSISIVRSKAYDLVGRLGIQSEKLEVRQAVITDLTSVTHDNDGGNIGQLWSLLSKFRKEDFSIVSKDSLKSSFRHKQPHLDQLLKLMGYLEMNEMKEEIRPMTLPPTDKRDRWAALLSMARMGDEVAVQSIVQRAEKLKVNDDVVYEIFPDLVYTRQPEAINYMITVLNSDEKNCYAADAENETRIPCAYRVMEQLASIIEDYPLKLDASGDVITKDYVKTLSDVRKWFQKKGTTYKIKKETF